jgi:hypothetical protein
MSKECSCGSGLIARPLYDARMVFCCYVCDVCEEEKRSHYRPEIFDTLYQAEEPIEPD